MADTEKEVLSQLQAAQKLLPPEDQILFTNPVHQNGKQLAKAIARSLSFNMEFPEPPLVIQPPKGKEEDAVKFWENVELAKSIYYGNVHGDIDKALAINAKLLTAKRMRASKRYKFGFSEVTDAATLFKLMEKKDGKDFISLYESDRQLREDWDSFGTTGSYPGGYTSSGPTFFNSEYAPIMGGPWAKQTYLSDMLAGNSRSFEAFNHSPIVHAALLIKHNFVYGRGVKVQCQDDQQQDIWDQFERENNFQNAMNKIVLDASIAGEVMLRYFPGDKPGKIKFRSTDPSSVWEIITDPEDVEKVYSYWQNFPTPYFIRTIDNIPVTKYIIRDVPPQEVDFLRLNVTSYERRGRPDCYAALTYQKWLRDYLWAKTIRAKIQNTYINDVEVDGNAGDIALVLNSFPNPQDPGVTFAHNKAVKFNITNPALGNEGRYAASDVLIALIGVSMGVPPEFLGGGGAGRGTRSGAMLASEPATKHFQDRQEQIGWLIRRMAFRVFTAAEKAGLLPISKDEDKDVKVIWASITKEDRSAKITDTKIAEEMEWISKRTSASMIAEEFDLDDYDFDEEQKIIKEDKDDGIYGEGFNDQYPQGQAASIALNQASKPEPQDTNVDFGKQPPEQQPNGKPPMSKAEKNNKANPFAQGSADLRKALKSSNRTVLQLRLSESDIEGPTDKELIENLTRIAKNKAKSDRNALSDWSDLQ